MRAELESRWRGCPTLLPAAASWYSRVGRDDGGSPPEFRRRRCVCTLSISVGEMRWWRYGVGEGGA